MIALTTIGETIVRLGTAGTLIFECGLSVDADGSPHAYHPDSHSGLDALGNAGEPGHWYGLACDDNGEPFIQGPGDPAPGFYVSTTALQNTAFATKDPRRYIDSESIPYIVLPGGLAHMPRLGAPARVINLRNGKSCSAIFADIGPRDRIGEGSIALARALDVPQGAREGGVSGGILFVVFQKA